MSGHSRRTASSYSANCQSSSACSWFGSDFAPEDWTYAQRFTYLWTELIPVLCFIAIGTSFWWMGRRVRAQAARAEAAAALGTSPPD